MIVLPADSSSLTSEKRQALVGISLGSEQEHLQKNDIPDMLCFLLYVSCMKMLKVIT